MRTDITIETETEGATFNLPLSAGDDADWKAVGDMTPEECEAVAKRYGISSEFLADAAISFDDLRASVTSDLIAIWQRLDKADI